MVGTLVDVDGTLVDVDGTFIDVDFDGTLVVVGKEKIVSLKFIIGSIFGVYLKYVKVLPT